ncbi:MAG: hypothetical protein INR73_08805 [Williamsia sp.]|nr:hypothetical protein [Williamsia sp.]
MKKTSSILLGILVTNMVMSQSATPNQITYLSHYVFPAFVKGRVQQKAGGTQEAMLNYNSMTQEMIFTQNAGYQALGQPENIDTVFIENRKFIPNGPVFYEVVPVGATPLFVNHKCRVIPPGNPAGYGTTSQTSSPGNISKIANNTQTYALKLPDDYQIVPETEFFLKREGEYNKISNIKQLAKLYPAKADAIQDYSKKNKINFKNQEDIVKLIQFCTQPS